MDYSAAIDISSERESLHRLPARSSAPICTTCGTQFAPNQRLNVCPICADERQYVGWQGQRWTTHETLSERHSSRVEFDDGVLGIGVTPSFAINQRALLLQTNAGNILWDCVSLVTTDAVSKIRSLGGIDLIAISHPHFYSSMLEWSHEFGAAPIMLHEADKQWVQRSDRQILYWGGDYCQLSSDVTLLRTGGHFPGSTALHWATGPRGQGALFSGDSPQVAMDRRHVAFMHSYPNAIPMRNEDVRHIERLLSDYSFDDIYGYTWGRNIIGQAGESIRASVARHLSRTRPLAA